MSRPPRGAAFGGFTARCGGRWDVAHVSAEGRDDPALGVGVVRRCVGQSGDDRGEHAGQVVRRLFPLVLLDQVGGLRVPLQLCTRGCSSAASPSSRARKAARLELSCACADCRAEKLSAIELSVATIVCPLSKMGSEKYGTSECRRPGNSVVVRWNWPGPDTDRPAPVPSWRRRRLSRRACRASSAVQS